MRPFDIRTTILLWYTFHLQIYNKKIDLVCGQQQKKPRQHCDRISWCEFVSKIERCFIYRRGGGWFCVGILVPFCTQIGTTNSIFIGSISLYGQYSTADFLLTYVLAFVPCKRYVYWFLSYHISCAAEWALIFSVLAIAKEMYSISCSYANDMCKKLIQNP